MLHAEEAPKQSELLQHGKYKNAELKVEKLSNSPEYVRIGEDNMV
jgi:hypothetical protein